MPETESERIAAFFSDTEKVAKAMGEAVQRALRVHKALGHPVVGWRDGKVVIIPPEEIEVEESPNGSLKLPQDLIP